MVRPIGAHWSISSVLTGVGAPGTGKAMFARAVACACRGVMRAGSIRPNSRMSDRVNQTPVVKLLEDALIKLSVVVNDPFGACGRRSWPR